MTRNKADHLVGWRWSKGVSGNPRGRPKKEHDLRRFLECTMLNKPIAPEFYRNAMLICGLDNEINELDALLRSGANLQDRKVKKIVPARIKKLRYGEYGAMQACFEAAKNPELFLKIIDQIYGKPIQATVAKNEDNFSKPASNVLVVTVPAEEDEPK